MEDSSPSGLTIPQALESAKDNENVSIKVKKKLEEKFADAWQKYQSMPHSYIPDQDEYLVLSHYRERFANDAQYEEVSHRFLKYNAGAADRPLRANASPSDSSQGQTQNTYRSRPQLSDGSWSIDRIHKKVDTSLSSVAEDFGLHEVTLAVNMNWNLPHFMKSEFDDQVQAAIGSVITLSGSALCAQATTCSEYIHLVWPLHGSQVLEVFQLALQDIAHEAEAEIADMKLSVSFAHGNCHLEVTNAKTIKDVSQILEQIVWMGAALRTSSSGWVQHSMFRIMADGASSNQLVVGLGVHFTAYDLAEAEKSCWIRLFANPTIAFGFPVHKRDNEEQGLEIPLEMMAALGGARHITNYEQGLVLKGFSAMFVPVKRYNDSVQWHLLFHRYGKRIFYRELKDLPSNRAMLDDVSHDFLRGARAFLGWWRTAETHLGTQEAAYGSIDWSPAKRVDRPIKFSGVEIGFQWIFTGKVNFIMGAKDGHFHLSRPMPFSRLVECASRTRVTLYDLHDRRAWLVPALEVMLHLVHAQHHSTPYQVRGKNVKLPTAAPQGASSAKSAILQNERLILSEGDSPRGNDYTLKDAILDLWSKMERLQEKDLDGAAGLTVHATTRDKLHGWELMSLIDKNNYFQQKEVNIEKTSGGWVDLINDNDTLVLMGTGFGEVIRPVSDLNRLCRKWRSLPQGKDYLAATVPIMEQLYVEAGSSESRKHLSTSHLRWHRGPMLFEDCTDPKSDRCGCDRTQQIRHDSLLRKKRPPEKKLENMGCVIFGRAHHPFKPTNTVTNEENPVYTLPNISLQSLELSTTIPPPDEPTISSCSDSSDD